jgi:hypothetical protein
MINLTWRKPIAMSGRFKWMLRKAYAYGGDAYVRNGSKAVDLPGDPQRPLSVFHFPTKRSDNPVVQKCSRVCRWAKCRTR